MCTLYTTEFYDGQKKGSFQSANVILPKFLEIVGKDKIKTAVDFGCGVGTWLAVFQKIVPDAKVIGMDSGESEERQFFISKESLIKADITKEIRFEEKYDVCFSLEVAEHIPKEKEEVYIKNLCNSSDIILFSAALKGQGGTGHVNEQPLSYWIEVFKKENYDYIDGIRADIWNDDKVSYWYKQNIIVFVKKGTVDIEVCRSKYQSMPVVDVIHPQAIQTSMQYAYNVIAERDKHIINRVAVMKKFPHIYRGLKRLIIKKRV